MTWLLYDVVRATRFGITTGSAPPANGVELSPKSNQVIDRSSSPTPGTVQSHTPSGKISVNSAHCPAENDTPG